MSGATFVVDLFFREVLVKIWWYLNFCKAYFMGDWLSYVQSQSECVKISDFGVANNNFF